MLGRRPAGVLCAGNLVLDILVRPVEQVRWGTTTWVDSIEQRLGGNGANTSYTLAALGVPVRLLGMVGRDSFGDAVIEKLERGGVDLAAVQRSEEATATTVGLVNAEGARSFLHRPGASTRAFAAPVDFTPEVTQGCMHLHLANVFGLPRMRAHAGETLRRAREAGLTTSLDTGWDAKGEWMRVLEPCLPHLDLLFVNQDEARMLTGSAQPGRAGQFFRDRGAGAVVVKLGADGCAVISGEGEFFAPAFHVPVVDTTGAGDCFCGGFLAALHHGASVADAARLANALGALSIQSLGAVEGLRPYGETLRWMESAVLRPSPALPHGSEQR